MVLISPNSSAVSVKRIGCKLVVTVPEKITQTAPKVRVTPLPDCKLPQMSHITKVQSRLCNKYYKTHGQSVFPKRKAEIQRPEMKHLITRQRNGEMVKTKDQLKLSRNKTANSFR